MRSKRLFIIMLFLGVLIPSLIYSQDKTLTSGMKITKSVRIKKGNYQFSSSAIDKPVILIEGNNIVVDFNNAVITGTRNANRPDSFTGVCIVIRNGNNITIKNAKAKGYKVALMAKGVNNLILENCDFSYNYRPQLNSTQEKEDMADWMSYHHNENDEWLRYGAAIYLRNCDSVNVYKCTVTAGQNALMMTECNNGRVISNDFSFNSGIGIGMYRCNRNSVCFNRVIFNVRGYSHGVYSRGQDSAGILVYEQSNHNSFYYNNVTHGGDGFFLWAGQTTMNTGQGGCNNNIVGYNDFSYAPTNGIEVTFSSNYIFDNWIYDCNYGIWGGYSYNTTIKGNRFRDNRVGIAIEHGQRNSITNNLFSGDKEAIRIWSNKLEPSDWGYPKYRDTRSVAYNISLNSFNNNPLVFSLASSDSLWIHDNTYNGTWANAFKIDSTITHLDSIFNEFATGSSAEPSVLFDNTSRKAFEGSGKFRGRKNIMMTEWGPYDFRYPLIWNTNPTDKSDMMKFNLFGPAGKWKIKKLTGVETISKKSGSFPDSIFAIKSKSDRTDILIELEYNGPGYTNVFGQAIPANKPQVFRFRKFFQPIDWEVRWFSLDTNSHNPIKTGSLFSPVERKAPLKTEKVNRLDYAWWGGLKVGEEQYTQFITIAEGQGEFKPGEYELSVTWDDAVRIYVDDKLVVNEWDPSRYKFDESPNRKVRVKLGGKQWIRVEHLELGGFACLSLKIKPLD